jgi:hypothetical protein
MSASAFLAGGCTKRVKGKSALDGVIIWWLLVVSDIYYNFYFSIVIVHVVIVDDLVGSR